MRPQAPGRAPGSSGRGPKTRASRRTRTRSAARVWRVASTPRRLVGRLGASWVASTPRGCPLGARVDCLWTADPRPSPRLLAQGAGLVGRLDASLAGDDAHQRRQRQRRLRLLRHRHERPRGAVQGARRGRPGELRGDVRGRGRRGRGVLPDRGGMRLHSQAEDGAGKIRVRVDLDASTRPGRRRRSSCLTCPT